VHKIRLKSLNGQQQHHHFIQKLQNPNGHQNSQMNIPNCKIFALIMNLCLDFTMEVCTERNVNKNFKQKKSITHKQRFKQIKTLEKLHNTSSNINIPKPTLFEPQIVLTNSTFFLAMMSLGFMVLGGFSCVFEWF
jgi:hypothetical protein